MSAAILESANQIDGNFRPQSKKVILIGSFEVDVSLDYSSCYKRCP